MKFFESVKEKLVKDRDGENALHLENTEVILAHFNIVNNRYLCGSWFLPIYVPNESLSWMHLRQLRSAYGAFEQSTKSKGRMQKLKETRSTQYIYHNELYKVCFQQYIAYSAFIYLPRRTNCDKLLNEKVYVNSQNDTAW